MIVVLLVFFNGENLWEKTHTGGHSTTQPSPTGSGTKDGGTVPYLFRLFVRGWGFPASISLIHTASIGIRMPLSYLLKSTTI